MQIRKCIGWYWMSTGVVHANLHIHFVFISVCVSLHPCIKGVSSRAIAGLPSGSQSPRSERPHWATASEIQEISIVFQSYIIMNINELVSGKICRKPCFFATKYRLSRFPLKPTLGLYMSFGLSQSLELHTEKRHKIHCLIFTGVCRSIFTLIITGHNRWQYLDMKLTEIHRWDIWKSLVFHASMICNHTTLYGSL